MGNCLSCFRADQVPQDTFQPHQGDANSLNNHHPHQPSLAFQASGAQECESNRDPSENSSTICLERRSPIPPVDAQSNGSSRNSNINMPEKRFCPRIPSLTKSSSDIKRNSSKECSETKINSLFEQYKDANFDAILSEGIIKFCLDLDVKPDDFKVLVLAWKFDAETMCCFTKEEFFNGCRTLRVDSIRGIQSKFPELLSEVQSHEKFKDLYRFTFKFGLDSESGQRILPSDIAIILWKLVFSQREPKILDRWIKFLENHPSIRGIPRDTWYMFLNFTDAVGEDLSSYDDTEAWPSLFDDFVEYENDKLNQNISKDQKMED